MRKEILECLPALLISAKYNFSCFFHRKIPNFHSTFYILFRICTSGRCIGALIFWLRSADSVSSVRMFGQSETTATPASFRWDAISVPEWESLRNFQSLSVYSFCCGKFSKCLIEHDRLKKNDELKVRK